MQRKSNDRKFRRHSRYVYKKINWKNVFDAEEKERFFYKEIDGELVWAYFIQESKSNRGLKDIADDIVGRIQPGDLQITRFAYRKECMNELIENILELARIKNKFIDEYKTYFDLN